MGSRRLGGEGFSLMAARKRRRGRPTLCGGRDGMSRSRSKVDSTAVVGAIRRVWLAKGESGGRVAVVELERGRERGAGCCECATASRRVRSSMTVHG